MIDSGHTLSGFQAQLASAADNAYSTARRLTGDPSEADDLLQDAALNALRGRHGYQPGTNFRAWFYRILINQHYSRQRQARRRPTTSLDDEAHGPSTLHSRFRGALDLDPATRLVENMDSEEIAAAIRSLPNSFQVAAILYFGEDLSYAEIATTLDIPIGTVRSRLHRARLLLRKQLRRVAESRGITPSARSLLQRLPRGSECRKVLAHLDGYLEGELDSADCTLIEEHLASCRRCRETLASEKAFAAALRSKLTHLPCPPTTRDRIMQSLAAAMAEA